MTIPTAVRLSDGLKWVKLWVKFRGPIKKPRKNKGLRASGPVKYGLKAARRAPQFSKR